VLGIALAALSGGLVAGALTPVGVQWLGWVALVPLLWIVTGCSGWRSALMFGASGGMVCGTMLLAPLVSAHLWSGWERVALRAVESGRFLVRATKTGVTAIIDPAGHEVARTSSAEPTVMLASVQPLHRLTPYARFGNWTVPGALTGILACLLRRPRTR
jgi:apolipoprotein N-acyltransferase